MTRFALSLLLTAGLTAPALAQGPQPNFPSALPPVSNAGECYAQVRKPAQYAPGSQQVVTQDAYAELAVTEPQMQSDSQTVLMKEASVRYEVRQPTYRTVREQIVTRPAHDRLSIAPPQFSTVTESLQTSAPHLVWKRGNPGELMAQGYRIHSTADGRLNDRSGYSGGSYGSTQAGGDACGPGCEIWCLVEEPGETVTTTRRVMSTPSRVIRTPVPAETKTLIKQVVDDPGYFREIEIPAEYAAIGIERLVRPAEAYEVNVPAEYGEVATRTLIAPESYEWRRVLCAPGTAPVRESYGQGGYSHGTYSQGTYSQSQMNSVAIGTTYAEPYAGVSSQEYDGHSVPSGTTPAYTQPRTGYYGTEDHPAYRR